jgi:transposase
MALWMADFSWFSDEQWFRIEPLLPCDTRGMPRVDDRRVLSVNLLRFIVCPSFRPDSNRSWRKIRGSRHLGFFCKWTLH